MQYRPDRLAQQLKTEISYILARELKDPRVGFVTITTAKVSPDLRQAQVYFSVFGSPVKQKETLAILNRSTGFIRRQLGSRVKLRHTPELQFIFDDSIEYGAKMDNLLSEVREELPEAETATENDPQSTQERSVI